MALRMLEKNEKLAIKGQLIICREDFFQTYKLDKERSLGRGLSGEVFLASFREKPSQKKAVKVFAQTETNAIFFLSEMAILQGFSHPNIIANVKALQCPDSFVLCMPYYPRGSLKQHLSPQLTTQRVIKYFLQLTSAVLYLHAHDIVHRDIKPENILLSDDDDVILIDFGLSCLVTSQQARKFRGGTADYLAPESFTGEKVDLFKGDLYSVGVVLWNMVFGRTKPDSEGYLHHVKKSKSLSVLFRTLLTNLLRPDPMDRWNDQQLANAVSAFSELDNMAKKLWGPIA